MTNRRERPSAEALDRMSRAEFVSAWCRIVGEPPAIMLDSRREMIRILVSGVSPMPEYADEPPVPPDDRERAP